MVAPVVQAHVVALQHTPVQGEGVQVLVSPWYISPPAHPKMPTGLHAQVVMLQQTPGHAEAQVPLHVNRLGATQVSGAVTEHVPEVLLQHLPMQGVGVQETAPQ
jgi:hypothetical protein